MAEARGESSENREPPLLVLASQIAEAQKQILAKPPGTTAALARIVASTVLEGLVQAVFLAGAEVEEMRLRIDTCEGMLLPTSALLPPPQHLANVEAAATAMVAEVQELTLATIEAGKSVPEELYQLVSRCSLRANVLAGLLGREVFVAAEADLDEGLNEDFAEVMSDEDLAEAMSDEDLEEAMSDEDLEEAMSDEDLEETTEGGVLETDEPPTKPKTVKADGS